MTRRTNRTRAALLVAFSVVLSIPFFGNYTTAEGQYVNGFGRTTNPYSSRKTNPYAGIYSNYGMPKTTARPNPYGGVAASTGNTFGYRPHVQAAPFANQRLAPPLVTSKQFARAEILRGFGYGGY